MCWPHSSTQQQKYYPGVFWRPLAYLQKASSAPRSPPGVQRAPVNHLPEVGLARCLFGNLYAKHTALPEPWAAQAQPDREETTQRLGYAVSETSSEW